MSSDYNIYKFGKFEFDIEEGKLIEDGTPLSLEAKPFEMLHFLVKNAGKIITKKEILDEVWDGAFVEESNIPISILKIRKALGDDSKHPKFIENIPRKGYRFISKVVVRQKEEDSSLLSIEKKTPPEQLPFENNIALANKSESSDFPFIILVSLLYGLLFGIGLLLESAYKFEHYAPQIYLQATGLFIWNGGLLFCVLVWVEDFFRKNKNYSLLFGTLILIFGIFLSFLIVSYILPDIPVTLTRFHAQPALAAFFKNELYFVFLGVFFILFPFHCVQGNRLKITNYLISPQTLFGILVLVLAYHIPSTFYLTDNLLPSHNQGFFVRLVLFRSFIFFVLGFGCVFWYFSQIGKGVIQMGKKQFALSVILGLFGFSFFLFTHSTAELPQLYDVKITANRDNKNQLFVEMNGEGFKTNTVRVRVITLNGEGCPSANPCLVDNGILNFYSKVSSTKLEQVPLTLPQGEYKLYVQNGESSMSNPFHFIVP